MQPRLFISLAPLALALALTLALTLATTALASPAHAKCAYYSEGLLTPEVTGPTPHIIAWVYGYDDALTQPTFALRGANQRPIPLETRAVHTGFRLAQVELVPTAPLVPGHYTLVRTNPPKDQTPTHLDLRVDAPSATSSAPRAPHLGAIKSTYERYGCGPAETLDLEVDGPGLYFVTLAEPHGATQRGYIALDYPTEGSGSPRILAIGHGMCSGSFTPQNGHRYHVTVQAVAPDGTLGPAASIDASYQGTPGRAPHE